MKVRHSVQPHDKGLAQLVRPGGVLDVNFCQQHRVGVGHVQRAEYQRGNPHFLPGFPVELPEVPAFRVRQEKGSAEHHKQRNRVPGQALHESRRRAVRRRHARLPPGQVNAARVQHHHRGAADHPQQIVFPFMRSLHLVRPSGLYI